ncbi:hypothetical protein HRbin15_01302 [bacterium HR15]|nr:hypothetical protein HRbin15_01302 [bacterium HR15]
MSKVLTVEAVVERDGTVILLQPVQLPTRRRALLLILDEPVAEVSETALLSEAALAEDWNRPEEDSAWSRLQ